MTRALMWLVLCSLSVEKGVCQVCSNKTFSELANDLSLALFNNIFVTNDGRLCKPWTDLELHFHRHISDTDFPYDSSMADAQNYCRAVDQDWFWWAGWCYTTITEWRASGSSCSRRICREAHCQDEQLAHYSGTVSETNARLTCQSWSSQTPHDHDFDSDEFFPIDGSVEDAHNYCRNVGNDDLPWCFTTDPRIRWQYCDAIICKVTGSQCVAYLTSPSGMISPFDSDGDGRYDNDLDCLWTIVAPEDMQILLDVHFYDFEDDVRSCFYDFIEIYETGYSHATLCNDSADIFTVVSVSNKLYVWFHSDHSGVDTGFSANYSHVAIKDISDSTAVTQSTAEDQATTPAPQDTLPAPQDTPPAPQDTIPAPQDTPPAPQDTTPANGAAMEKNEADIQKNGAAIHEIGAAIMLLSGMISLCIGSNWLSIAV